MFCPRPWTQFYIDEQADAWQCCPGWVTRSMGNVLDASPLEIWRSEAAEAVRASILDGSFRHCEHCPFLPDQFMPAHLEPGPARVIPLDRIESVVLSYDPACNLQCPSCRLAPRLNARAGDIHQAMLRSELLGMARNISLSDVGDPLASLLHWRMLCDLPALAPHLSVSLHTNGLLLTPEKWDKLGKARDQLASITISIDAATEETYAKNRGGDWRRLLANMAWLSRIRSLALDLNFVYQENNFREMPAFVALADSFRAKRVRFSYLANKGTYSADDYRVRAMHLPGHPSHAEFLEVLAHPLLSDRSRILVTL
jgi:hypothetical protein